MQARVHRRPLSTAELIPRYTKAFVATTAAAVAGAVATVGVFQWAHAGCTWTRDGAGGEWTCPDGVGYAIPALFGGCICAVAALALMAVLTARRTSAATVELLSTRAMWSVLLLMLLLGVAWPALTLSQGNALGLLGFIGVGLAAVPLAVAHYRRTMLPVALGSCLLVPLAVLVDWQDMLLLVPLAATVTGAWATALVLWMWARRIHAQSASA